MAALLPATAQAQRNDRPPHPEARAWVLVDGRSKDVLAQREEDLAAPIASATKMMTALVALRTLRPGEVVAAPRYDANPGESLMRLRPGEAISVRDLLYGLLLVSGNDAASALAQAASGSEAAFVERMNVLSERLELDATSFSDPIGLSTGNVSSASDLVALASQLRKNPLLRRVVDTERITLEGERTRHLVNRNSLVLREPWVDGVKTGFTAEAGYVLVASGERRGVPLVATVLGAPSEDGRDAAALELLRYGASLYEERALVRGGERLTDVALELRDETLALEAERSLRRTIRADQHVRTRIEAPAELSGPVTDGERVGAVTVFVDGERAGRVRLVAASSASAPNWLDRLDAEVPGGRITLWALMAALGLALVAVAWAVTVLARRRSR